jgi:hypothetical protein
MFSAISANWRGKPLADHETILELIRHAGTEEGLHIQAELDTAIYETGRKIPDVAFKRINLYRYTFHGEWNYKISPQI